jgi:hypothetical protein
MPRRPQFYSHSYLEVDLPESPSELKPFTRYANTGGGHGVGTPFWTPLMAFAAMAATPWWCSSKRFSLRTLLIATTLIAFVLGLTVYASR